MEPREPASTPIPGADTTCAIVVTFNRKELLMRCLAALEAQEEPVARVLVVDNASTDGTAELVREQHPGVEIMVLPENAGGAGGFHAGMAHAYDQGYEWLWVMDDDTLAEPGALAALLAGSRRAPGPGKPLMLSSVVRWKDERLHPMNTPTPRWRWLPDLVHGAGDGLVLLRNATFVSVLLHREAVRRFGLPLEHYFIWTDDVEYTSRVLREDPGWLVPESVVHHWTKIPHTAIEDSGGRFYYHVRNSLLLLRGTSLTPIERLDYGRYWLRSLRAYFEAQGLSRATATLVGRGLWDGLRGEVR